MPGRPRLRGAKRVVGAVAVAAGVPVAGVRVDDAAPFTDGGQRGACPPGERGVQVTDPGYLADDAFGGDVGHEAVPSHHAGGGQAASGADG
jgi:hypothetical protein